MNEIYECNSCGTQFEADVADRGPNGEQRCPQCLLLDARRVARGEEKEFVVTALMPFT